MREETFKINGVQAILPFDVQLADVDGNAVLPMDGMTGGGLLVLEIRNRSGETIEFVQFDGAPSDKASHLTLSFRPGILSETTRAFLIQADLSAAMLGTAAGGWSVAATVTPDRSQPVALHFKSLGGHRALAPGGILQLELGGLSGAADRGPQLTRVEVSTGLMRFQGAEHEIDATRTAPLFLAPWARRPSPLNVWIEDGTDALAVGRSNTINLRISNPDPLTDFSHSDGSRAAPRINLRLEPLTASQPWGLLPLADLFGVSMTGTYPRVGSHLATGFFSSVATPPAGTDPESVPLPSWGAVIQQQGLPSGFTMTISLTLPRPLPPGPASWLTVEYTGFPGFHDTTERLPLSRRVYTDTVLGERFEELRAKVPSLPSAEQHTPKHDAEPPENGDAPLDPADRGLIEPQAQLDSIRVALARHSDDIELLAKAIPGDLRSRLEQLETAMALLKGTADLSDAPEAAPQRTFALAVPDSTVVHTKLDPDRRRLTEDRVAQYRPQPGAQEPYIIVAAETADDLTDNIHSFGGALCVAYSNIDKFVAEVAEDVSTYFDGPLRFAPLILPPELPVPDGKMRLTARQIRPDAPYDIEEAKSFNAGMPHTDTEAVTFDCFVKGGKLHLHCVNPGTTQNITIRDRQYRIISQIFHKDNGFFCLSFDGSEFRPGPVPEDI